MEQKNQRNPRRRLNSLILLVAFTAVMLIVSTYAWFSSQKNVTLSNLTGTVKVVEGLEISLDAKNWSQEVDFSKYSATQLASLVYLATTETTDDTLTHNIVPTEMLPVSTNGAEGVGSKEITMMRGENVNSIQLKNVKATQLTWDDDNDTGTAEVATTASANPDIYPGYYAIDFFLKNTSATGVTSNVLQLNSNSAVQVKTGGNASTGIQNTPRVALALFESVDADGANNTENAIVDTMAEQSEIITKTMTHANSTITDVAIWEPNANEHVDYIVNRYKPGATSTPITWKAADKTGYLSVVDGDSALTGEFTATEKIPTYALLESSIAGTATNRMTDIYNWSGVATGKTYLDENGTTLTETGYDMVAKQIALQTSRGGGTDWTVAETYYDLISADQTGVTDYEKAFYNNSPATVDLNKFEIPANEICRLRMYVWLEGQDVDCLNYASHGGGIEVDLGLIKDAGAE